MPLVVAANRDEFYARPTASAHFWDSPDGMLAGQDLQAGGTWMGVDARGRFAAVTNVGEPPPDEPRLSRGALVQGFLASTLDATHYASQIQGHRYRGYNLLLWDGEQLLFSSNRSATRVLPQGVYGLANATLDESRYKVDTGKLALQDAVASQGDAMQLSARLLDLLRDRQPPQPAEAKQLPGRSAEEIQALGARFIVGSDYGTRASTAIIIGQKRVHFAEQSYVSGGHARGRSQHEYERRSD